jgi:hypothetical protein
MKFLSVFALLALTFSGIFAHTNLESAFAHERSFPTKQLTALTPEGLELTYKESAIKADKEKLSAAEKKYGFVYSKGELLGNLFLGMDKDKKVKAVSVFLDGKSDKGDTEFGASVDTSGKILKVAIYSSPESGEATSNAFLESLSGKSRDDLEIMKKALPEGDKSKRFIVELAQKALLRVESSFGRK